jgi:sugar/nucleoside kinase (ribokinase family)
MGESSTPRTIFMGQLRRDFYILHNNQVVLDVPGGNVLYASVGYLTWETEPPPGIVARVGEDYPQLWLEEFTRRGINTEGVSILPEAVDLRTFYVFPDRTTRIFDDPVAHFARLGIPFPKVLLGYRPPKQTVDSRTQLSLTSLRQGDIPPHYLDAQYAHLCPIDYLTHTLMPAVLRQAGFTVVTLDPSPGCMTPIFWDDIPALITGLTAFMPAEDELCKLFHGRSTDIWEMMMAVAAYGCEFVIVKCGAGGQLLYDAVAKTRWEIPAYPARLYNPTGAGDAFCGGFLAGYLKTYDPLQAVMHGNISASLIVEGSNPFYALDVLPGLPQARLEALRETARKV